MPKVSIIIPTHNCGLYLKDSVNSALGQSYDNLEIMVVDDGSTDDTQHIIKPYLASKKNVYIKKPERKGLSAARNTGIDAASGDLVAFLDADDIFLKDKILAQVDCLKKDGSCGACYTNEIYFREDNGKEVISNRPHFSGDIFYYLKRSNFMHVSTVMVKKELLKENRFDESLTSHEDWEFFMRIAYKGVRFAFAGKIPYVRIRVRQNSMTANSGIMDETRELVGLKAKAYWKELKSQMGQPGAPGQKAILRYLKLKAKAFALGFPGSSRFNQPVPQDLLRD